MIMIGHFIINTAIKHSACCFFVYPSPLFEEECNTSSFTLVFNITYPFLSHNTGFTSRLSSYYHPINSRQIEVR